MYIKEYENVEVILTHCSQPKKWENDFGLKPEINKSYFIHWSFLRTKSNYRRNRIKIECDDCHEIFEKRICDLIPDISIHYCIKCQNKGERNGMYGKSYNENCKIGLKKWTEKNGNPFTWKETKQKIKEKNPWLKISEKNTGQKRSEDVREKMSLSAINSFKNGKRKPNSGWGKITIKQYKGIDYQSTYELKFLKYLESLDKLHLIERGPRVSYTDSNNKEHSYFIDYKIKNTNIVFEIKSSYIWKKHEKINLIKKQEAEKLYQYHLVMDNKFKLIENILTNGKKEI